jgi:hypothetical protein
MLGITFLVKLTYRMKLKTNIPSAHANITIPIKLSIGATQIT